VSEPIRDRAPAGLPQVIDGPRLTHLDGPAEAEACDHCGVRALSWRKCKLVCGNCAQVNKSCADL
jgi:hypothetical protein